MHNSAECLHHLRLESLDEIVLNLLVVACIIAATEDWGWLATIGEHLRLLLAAATLTLCL